MQKIEELILMFEVSKKIERDVADAVETYLHDPIKAHLENLPANQRRDGIEAAGLVKAYIQEDRAKDIPDVEAITRDVGDLTGAQLKDMLVRGVIAISLPKPEIAAAELAALGSNKDYTKHIPGGGRQALRTLVLDKGAWQGLAGLITNPLKIGDQIRDLALKSQAKAIQAALGTVVINAKKPV